MIHRCEKHGLAWASEDPNTVCADCAHEGRTNFSVWERATLEQFARDAAEENKQLRDDNRVLLDAWRKAVSKAVSKAASHEVADSQRAEVASAHVKAWDILRTRAATAQTSISGPALLGVMDRLLKEMA